MTTPSRETLIQLASTNDLLTLRTHLTPDPISTLSIHSLTPTDLLLPAITSAHPAIISYLLTTFPSTPLNTTPVQRAVLETNTLPIYEAVVPTGFNLNYDHGPLGGPLCWVGTDLPLARYLLSHGADPNRDMQSMRFQPLAVAARNPNCSREMVELFIEHGAQIDRSGALVLAARAGNVDVVRALLERGPRVEVGWGECLIWRRREEVESAEEGARREGREELVRVLREWGAREREEGGGGG